MICAAAIAALINTRKSSAVVAKFRFGIRIRTHLPLLLLKVRRRTLLGSIIEFVTI